MDVDATGDVYVYLFGMKQREMLRRQDCDYDGGFRFADRAHDAPVLAFDDALTFQLMSPKQAFVLGDKPSPFLVRIGTPGVGAKAFLRFFSEDLAASAEIAFPNRNPHGKPIVVQATLKAPG